MADKEKKLTEITITRATVVTGLGRVERARVLQVGPVLSVEDARLLINIKKAVAGKVDLKEKKSGDK